jgi:hypothetical protein
MKSFKDNYPEYAPIEHLIRRARVERSVAIAHAIVGIIETVGRGFRKLAEMMDRELHAERDRRAVQADAFLKRSVPKY